MRIGIAIRKNETDYFVHKSYILLLEKYNYSYDFVTIYTDLSLFDGFLLPGGFDIDPKYYNQENYASKNVDAEMDFLDNKIIQYCVQEKKPLLGICRGIQSINVFLGGSLKQNILNHSNENHFIKLNKKYYLVNSFHHQSIHHLAKDLLVLAKSIDDEIEIIKHKDLPIYGVQFHPELIDLDLKEIFSEF
ncbi:MAG: gamma-glutamyl-gamma-aminobutyrate hydrolase family protein [Anaeroplasmataceae bacterium]|nr:gamma-glutamyl-gamma-aminobutyrate hydrolase family protein [Anaeroplasmataceae bacterium]